MTRYFETFDQVQEFVAGHCGLYAGNLDVYFPSPQEREAFKEGKAQFELLNLQNMEPAAGMVDGERSTFFVSRTDEGSYRLESVPV